MADELGTVLSAMDGSFTREGDKVKLHDDTFGFSGKYVTGPTTISFTASNDGSGVLYTSDPDGQYNPTTAQGGAGEPAIALHQWRPHTGLVTHVSYVGPFDGPKPFRKI